MVFEQETKMKHLFSFAIFILFALASTNGGSYRETREVSQRVRRSDDSLWNLFRQDKDKKKKKKDKKTTVKPTVQITTTSPPISTTKVSFTLASHQPINISNTPVLYP